MVPTASQHDLVIIGGGPGGYAAALYGAAAGLDVAMIEQGPVGGTCLHVGCIPAKELLETAAVFHTVAEASVFGVQTAEPTIDMAVTQRRKQHVIDTLTKGLEGLLKKRKVSVFRGVGTLGPERTVTVRDPEGAATELVGAHVVVATGSVPRTIPGFDVDGELVLTSDEFLSLDRVPSSAAVIGGGAIGCEFASTLADLGCSVTLLEALPKLLPGCDEDVTREVVRSFKKRGIEVRTGVAVAGHTPGPGGTAVALADGTTVEVEVVIVAIGRRPQSETAGLEHTAVAVDERGYVVVDQLCRTAEPGVYAVGDVIATPQLAHIGFAEGMLVVRDILGEQPLPIDYGAVPWCIYCRPEVAFAGHSEESARQAGFEVVVSKHRFAGNGRAMIVNQPEGLVKIIAEQGADGRAGRILGVHMVGPWVTEQLGQGYLAVNWEATVDEVAHFIQPHPTMSELFGESVLALTGRGLHG